MKRDNLTTAMGVCEACGGKNNGTSATHCDGRTHGRMQAAIEPQQVVQPGEVAIDREHFATLAGHYLRWTSSDEPNNLRNWLEETLRINGIKVK